MTVTINSSTNPAAAGVPGLFVNVGAPPATILPGAPTARVGVVGVASWGPLNVPVTFADEPSGVLAFGAMANRKFDLMTQAHMAALNGANDFRGVRVSDGSDVAASVVIQTSGITLTGKYTGTDGNGIRAAIGTGTAAATWKLTLTAPGRQPEVFDNIPGTLNAAWVAMAAAVNAGQGSLRGPSNLVVATAGASVTSPVLATGIALTGGADGAAVTAAALVGVDTSPRTGMYALRNTNIGQFVLADADDSTQWAAQYAFAVSELAYGFAVAPAGQAVASFATAMAGIDNAWLKVIFGDWIYIQDGVNNLLRMVSPGGVGAGRKAAVGPDQSLLNVPLYGVVGTQSSMANKRYSQAELAAITAARGDVIIMESPGGSYPSFAFGRNSSSDISRRQDTYTGMTNYFAKSLDQAAGLGQFVGRNITPTQMREAESALGGFCENERIAGRIGNAQGTIPYFVQVGPANNPQISINMGIENALVMVQYFSVLEYFLVNLTGGQTVVIPQQQLAA